MMRYPLTRKPEPGPDPIERAIAAIESGQIQRAYEILKDARGPKDWRERVVCKGTDDETR